MEQSASSNNIHGILAKGQTKNGGRYNSRVNNIHSTGSPVRIIIQQSWQGYEEFSTEVWMWPPINSLLNRDVVQDTKAVRKQLVALKKPLHDVIFIGHTYCKYIKIQTQYLQGWHEPRASVF